jgi:hypothetical protein
VTGKTKFLILIFIGAGILAPSFQSHGAESLNLLRRWVVFPFDADTPALKNAAENAWWKTREKLTSSKKYLVASRQFLIQKDVFQPRKELSPEDVKYLARHLDADAIITGFSEDRQFQINAYAGQNGKLLWSKHLGFHPSLKATDQLELISDKLTQEFLSQVPYQGFVITDPIVGKTIYDENNKKLAMIDTGLTGEIEEGMEVQFIQVNLPEETPLFAKEKIEVLGEGKIIKIESSTVIAEIDRAKSWEKINDKTLVTIPKLAIKLGESYVGAEVAKEKNAPENLPKMINPVAPESQGAHKQTIVFGSVLSVIGLLLLGL